MTNVIMPKLGLTMQEGTVTTWYVKVGDQVKAGEPLCDIETDKLTNSVNAKVDGTVKSIEVPEGETVPCQTVLAVLE